MRLVEMRFSPGSLSQRFLNIKMPAAIDKMSRMVPKMITKKEGAGTHLVEYDFDLYNGPQDSGEIEPAGQKWLTGHGVGIMVPLWGQ